MNNCIEEFGRWLIAEKMLSKEQWREAQKRACRDELPLPIVLANDYLSPEGMLAIEREFYQQFAASRDIPFVDLWEEILQPEAVRTVHPFYLRNEEAVPYRLERDLLLIASTHLPSRRQRFKLSRLTRLPVICSLSTPYATLIASKWAEGLYEAENSTENSEKSPMVRFFNTILQQAIVEKLHCLHWVVKGHSFCIYAYRNGEIWLPPNASEQKKERLRQQDNVWLRLPLYVYYPLMSHLKYLAKMACCCQPLAQESVIEFRYREGAHHVRVATEPDGLREKTTLTLLQ